MSLLCFETERDIEYGTPLYAGTRLTHEIAYALSGEAVDRIPQESRGTRLYAKSEGGINIYRGTAGRNFTGSYAWSSFHLAEFLFSISEEDAKRYLPRLHTELGRT